jgi:hypothetical protein
VHTYVLGSVSNVLVSRSPAIVCVGHCLNVCLCSHACIHLDACLSFLDLFRYFRYVGDASYTRVFDYQLSGQTSEFGMHGPNFRSCFCGVCIARSILFCQVMLAGAFPVQYIVGYRASPSGVTSRTHIGRGSEGLTRKISQIVFH